MKDNEKKFNLKKEEAKKEAKNAAKNEGKGVELTDEEMSSVAAGTGPMCVKR